MLSNLLKFLGFHLHDASKPHRVYYNASRFPNVEVAKLYNAVVNVYVNETLDTAIIVNECADGLPEKESSVTFKFPKLSFLSNDSDACIRMNNEAEKMLLTFEKEMYDRRAEELKELYSFFEGFRPEVKSFPEIVELVDFIRGRLKSWAEFEVAKMLPLWLFWFGHVTNSRFHKWYQSIYFEVYLDGINEIELPVVTKIFDTYISSNPTGIDFNLYAQLN